MDKGVFQNETFWLFYHGIGDFEPGQIFELGVEEKFDRDGNPLPVSINLDCGPRYKLELLIWMEVWGMELWIVDKKTDTAQQIAWWDDKEWHPYCFRWEELMTLVDHWTKDPQNPDQDALICLLARFTGNSPLEKGGYETMENRRGVVKKSYQALGISNETIEKLLPESFLTIEDYQWVKDGQFGWMFTGDYACYSIRNHEHVGGKNQFPFDWYKAMLENLSAKPA